MKPSRPRQRVRLALALGVATALWAGARGLEAAARSERAEWPKTAGDVLLPPPGTARFVSLGYHELLADLTWCRALVYYGSNWAGEGDLAYLERFVDLIIEADPRFKAVYDWAPYAVVFKKETPTQEEFRTSLRYLDRAMAEFPDDYEYFWLAGARYYWDLEAPDEETRKKNRERGAEFIERAMQKPNAPPDLATTAANMRSRLGQHERALENLRQMILITDNEEARENMLERMRVTDPDLADALAEAQADLVDSWVRSSPYLPLDFFVVLGPPPAPVIDFRALTTPHDLFGVDTDSDVNGNANESR